MACGWREEESTHPKMTALYPTVVTLRNCSRFSSTPNTWYRAKVTCTQHSCVENEPHTWDACLQEQSSPFPPLTLPSLEERRCPYHTREKQKDHGHLHVVCDPALCRKAISGFKVSNGPQCRQVE